ncbi:homoserine/homoserine lactone efflux protein [Rhodoferax lithotrophicus]|uniref:Homoserine/homoserine lactone efflux protein n=1 Tax=Rhodoferax lithotrophicus TaxID=2798804 RepID=A0ABN6DGQ2_9BURK|nr:LysE family translocator [Rhodoferax sp. MIZ03]BCO29348.1 homoserine/homoserine lactone efflux protein [Rhodoferax sp. MIZ03]
MPEFHQLLLFILAGWLLNLTPGPDVLYIVTHSLRSGARAGIVAGLGITTGCFVHIFAAALGVGALLAASVTAFNLLKWAGAAYLLYVGFKLLLSRAETSLLKTASDPSGERVQVDLWRVYSGGFWTNVLNPKVAIFFLAFVPQFIAPGTAQTTWVFLALGVLFNVNAIPVNIGWALAAAWMARRASLVQRGMHWLDRAAGAMFIGFGLKLALSDNPAS